MALPLVSQTLLVFHLLMEERMDIPFPVPLKVYDQTIDVLKKVVERAKIGPSDKKMSMKKLHELTLQVEKDFTPNNSFQSVLAQERLNLHRYGGMTVNGPAKPVNEQLSLF